MDSLIVTQLIRNIARHHSTILRVIIMILQQFWDVKVHYTYREGNKVVDGLTTMAYLYPLDVHSFVQPSQEVLNHVHDDNIGRT
ncbi:hypothetical protein PVK06_040607 [Gossypium arboreum]|uniref:RNase H type-1 domain-containing protein n=1 Tax=Gossypium arboreum TaxID=29729 RepID=A0ABR0N6R3_GOSAR|nr:hypothetical protein PVK06_040607 [Gossypium arboreum]